MRRTLPCCCHAVLTKLAEDMAKNQAKMAEDMAKMETKISADMATMQAKISADMARISTESRLEAKQDLRHFENTLGNLCGIGMKAVGAGVFGFAASALYMVNGMDTRISQHREATTKTILENREEHRAELAHEVAKCTEAAVCAQATASTVRDMFSGVVASPKFVVPHPL